MTVNIISQDPSTPGFDIGGDPNIHKITLASGTYEKPGGICVTLHTFPPDGNDANKQRQTMIRNHGALGDMLDEMNAPVSTTQYSYIALKRPEDLAVLMDRRGWPEDVQGIISGKLKMLHKQIANPRRISRPRTTEETAKASGVAASLTQRFKMTPNAPGQLRQWMSLNPDIV